jgi:DNA sulfur modification protein DndB
MVEIARLKHVVRGNVGNRQYCFGVISSDRIKDLTFVPVIEESEKTYLCENTDGGYQRPGSPSRMRAFMSFLRDNKNSVVPPILLSDRGAWSWAGGQGDVVGELAITGRAAIVDGQHRVGGYVALFERDNDARDVPFILITGLSVGEEKEEFVIVNNTQKGVPRPLTEFLKGTEEAQIAWELNTDPDSPFHNRISRTGMQKTHLFALHSVAKQMKELFKLGALSDLDPETRVDYAERFFNIISDVLQTEWSDIELLEQEEGGGRKNFQYKLLELTGLIAWCAVGSHILMRSYSEEQGMNWDNVRRLVGDAANVDWSKTGQFAGRTGAAGARVMTQEMMRLLPPETVSSEDREATE